MIVTFRIFRILAILLRILLHSSPIAKKFSKILSFDTQVYSINILKENSLIHSFTNKSSKSIIQFSDNYFSSLITQKLLYFIQNNFFGIIFFSLIDVSIGIFIAKIKRNLNKVEKTTFINSTNCPNESNESSESQIQQKNNLSIDDNSIYYEMFYLFNPISILNCVNLRLDIFYTFLTFMFVNNTKNIFGPLFLVLSLLTSPGYIFLNLFMLINFFYSNSTKDKFKFIFKCIGCLSLIGIILGLSEINSKFDFNNFLGYLKFFSEKLIQDVTQIYYNYYTIKDTLPNIGILWALLPETFLKFQNYSYLILINYHFILNFAIICLVSKINYQNKNSILFALLIMVNHIIDRYPCENHYVIIMLLIMQHSDLVKEKVLTLAVFCTISGYTLIFSRGYPFKMKRHGSSNYLFFQNLTYMAFLIFVLLLFVSSIRNTIKKQKIKTDIIESFSEINSIEDNNCIKN